MSRQMPLHPDDEERLAVQMARELDALAADSGVVPTAGFADRVMVAVAAEPLPQPARAFGVALLRGHLRAAAASVGDAWRVVVGGSTPRFVRAQALALVLVVALGSLAVAGGAAVGAVNMLTPNPIVSPTPALRAPSPSPRQPAAVEPPPTSVTPTPSPDESAEVSPSDEPSETTEPTQTPDSATTSRPQTPEPTESDDHGGRGPGLGVGGGDETPSPTATGSDDHSHGHDHGDGGEEGRGASGSSGATPHRDQG